MDFDPEGYPTVECLLRIKGWDWKDCLGCLAYVRSNWHWQDYVSVTRSDESTVFRFVTGGWSGNEDLIAALHGNTMVWTLTWKMSQSGGLHVFHHVPMKD